MDSQHSRWKPSDGSIPLARHTEGDGEPVPGPAGDPCISGLGLRDAEALIFHHPRALSAEGSRRIREQLQGWSEREFGRRVPALILEDGATLEVVRSGGWVYCYERQPTAPGFYEAAHIINEGEEDESRRVERFFWSGKLWPMDSVYAWRPCPEPPPMRREAR